MFTNLIREIGALAAITAAAVAGATTAYAQSPAGAWTLYPPQTTVYEVTPQQPVNADGTSNFKNNGKSVIPIKFEVSRGTGPVVFQSIFSDVSTTNDYSYLSLNPSGSFLFSQISNLSAVYSFLEGDCQGGSLRWEIGVDNSDAIFIYYGGTPNFTDCTTTGNNQSGINLLTVGGLRFDTSQLPGGTFYDTYAHALALAGGQEVRYAALVIDSGWVNAPNGDQRLTPSNVTVNSNTFIPLDVSSGKICSLPPADIQVTKTSGVGTGPVNEPVSIQPGASDDAFRIVDCKYMYNLATSSLSGPGRYKVEVLINGVTLAQGAAEFDLR